MMEEVLSQFKDRPNFVVTSYSGSSVSDLELLRRNLKKISADYLVVKNSILKIIFEKLKLENQISNIEGGMGVSFSGEDIVSTCSVLVTFAKDHDKFKIKSAIIDGKTVAADKVKALAALPPRKVLLAQVVGGMKAPITGFVGVLGGVIRKFVYVVDAVKVSKEKQAASSAPQSAPEPAKS
jgi:large subunit ribosomal protein L10